MQHKTQIGSACAFALAVFVNFSGAGAALAESPLASADDARYSIRAVFNVGEHEERIYEAVVHLTWADFGADGTNLATCQFESLKADVTLSDGRRHYECRLEGGEGVLPVSDGWSDEALAGVRFIVSSPLEIVLNAAGEIERVAGLQRVNLMSEVLGEEVDDAFGPFMPDQIGRTLGPIFHADGASAPPSDSWESTREWSLGSARTLSILGSWRLGEVAGDVAAFGAELSMTVDPGESASSLSPVVQISDLEGNADAIWNMAAGTLLEREQTLSFSATWSVRAISEAIGITSTLTVVRLDAEPDAD